MENENISRDPELPVVEPVRSLDFAILPPETQYEALLMAFVKDGSGSIGTILERLGASYEDYERICLSPNFTRDVKEYTKALVASPALPGVVRKMAQKAMEGDSKVMMDFLKYYGAVEPPQLQLNQQNNYYGDLSDEQLAAKLDLLKRQLLGGIVNEDDRNNGSED